jgi:hypothetical protein
MQNGLTRRTSVTDGALETGAWSDTVPSLTSETSQHYASTSGTLLPIFPGGLWNESDVSAVPPCPLPDVLQGSLVCGQKLGQRGRRQWRKP